MHKRKNTQGQWKYFLFLRVQFVCVCVLSLVRLFAAPCTASCQAPLSMGFSRQEYWSGLPCLPPRDLPNPGTEPRSPTLQADSLPSEPPGKPKNIGVGGLSLLQGIFPTQELNFCIAGGFFTSWDTRCMLSCSVVSDSLYHQGCCANKKQGFWDQCHFNPSY